MPVENTNGDLFPAVSACEFTVYNIPEKKFYETGQPYYSFSFTAQVDGEKRVYTEKFAMWMCGPIFKALGCPEVKSGHFDVNPPELLGKLIIASIKHETIMKGKSAGKVVAKMCDIKAAAETDDIAF